MTPEIIKASVILLTGVALAGVSAYMHVNNEDGSGWGIFAFLLIITGVMSL